MHRSKDFDKLIQFIQDMKKEIQIYILDFGSDACSCNDTQRGGICSNEKSIDFK